MPFQTPGNRPYGHLSAAILASATSLTLNSAAEAARFHAIAAGDFYYLVLVDTAHTDLDDNWTIVKATAKSSSTFTIEGGFDGTAAKAMPRSSVGDPTKVRVWAPMSKMQLWMYLTGGGAVVQAAMPTVSADSPELFLLTPTGAGNFDLPTTDVWAGARYEIHNLSSTGANVVTIRSSDTGTVCILPASSSVILQAIQDAPTTNAHWKAESSWIDPDSLFVYGGTSTKHFKPMGTIDAQTTQTTSASGDADIMTYTLPGGTMGENGEMVLVFGVGTNTSGTALSNFFGTTEFQPPSSSPANFFYQTLIVRSGGSAQKGSCISIQVTDAITGGLSDYSSGADSLASDVVVRLHKTGGSLTQEFMITGLYP